MSKTTHACTTLLILMLALVCSPAVLAQGTTTDEAATDPVKEEFQPLLTRFVLMAQSLEAQDGIAARDKPLLTDLRTEVMTFSQGHPQYMPALAIIAQMSIWLKDDQTVFDYFEKLVVLDPDNLQLAVDWEAYFTESGDDGYLERVQQRLQELRPNDIALAKRRADAYLQRGDYSAIVDVLSGLALDPAQDTWYLQVLSSAQAAMNNFADAAATLRSIPPEVSGRDPRKEIEINNDLKSWDEYIALWALEQQLRAAEASAGDLPIVEIDTARGKIVLELFENEAPNTVANFIKLATDNFWPGTLFHRVEPGVLIQGGDPFSRPGETRLAGTGTPGYHIPDEHHLANRRNHFTGSLAMAKGKMDDTAGCQFYITMRPTPWLNGKHTVFGRVLEGMDVVRSIKPDDEIMNVTVLRKRDHEYVVDTLPLDEDLYDNKQQGDDTGAGDDAGGGTGAAGGSGAAGGGTGDAGSGDAGSGDAGSGGGGH